MKFTTEPAKPAELLFLEVQDHAPDPLWKNSDVEVQEQPHRTSGQVEIGEQLRFMHAGNLFDGLDFHDNSAFHQEVEAISAIEQDSLVPQRKSLLSFECQTAKRQFVGEAGLVTGFQLPRADFTVDFDSRADDALRQVVDLHGCQDVPGGGKFSTANPASLRIQPQNSQEPAQPSGSEKIPYDSGYGVHSPIRRTQVFGRRSVGSVGSVVHFHPARR